MGQPLCNLRIQLGQHRIQHVRLQHSNKYLLTSRPECQPQRTIRVSLLTLGTILGDMPRLFTGPAHPLRIQAGLVLRLDVLLTGGRLAAGATRVGKFGGTSRVCRIDPLESLRQMALPRLDSFPHKPVHMKCGSDELLVGQKVCEGRQVHSHSPRRRNSHHPSRSGRGLCDGPRRLPTITHKW